MAIVGVHQLAFEAVMIQGILFDKDGTLIDFNGTWLKPYQQACDYLADIAGRPELSAQLMKDGGYDAKTGCWACDSVLASGNSDQILDFWEEQLSCRLTPAQRLQIEKIFSYSATLCVPAVTNLRGLLEQLKWRRIRLGLATMDNEANALMMLKHLELSEFFEFVCGADSGHGNKPDPGMVYAFCNACGLPCNRVIVVGDSPKDLCMGSNAKVALSVGVLSGAHERDQLNQYADVILENISGLPSLLE